VADVERVDRALASKHLNDIVILARGRRKRLMWVVVEGERGRPFTWAFNIGARDRSHYRALEYKQKHGLERELGLEEAWRILREQGLEPVRILGAWGDGKVVVWALVREAPTTPYPSEMPPSRPPKTIEEEAREWEEFLGRIEEEAREVAERWGLTVEQVKKLMKKWRVDTPSQLEPLLEEFPWILEEA